MNYLPRSRRSTYGKKVAFLITLFVLGAIFFILFGNIIVTIISPVWRGQNIFSQSLRNSADLFKSRNALIDENTKLKQQISSLELSLASVSQDSSNNFSTTTTGVSGLVLTHPPQSPYDLVLVDLGKGRVNVSERVFLPEGPEIGVVSQVFGRTAQIKLYTSVGEKTNAVLERHQVPVEIEGVGAGNYKIVIPRETEVQVGDRVISPSQEASLMAVVESVDLTSTDAFKTIYAKSPTNIFSIRNVYIRP